MKWKTAVAGFAAAFFVCGHAGAATVDGSLLTNRVGATFMGTAGPTVRYEASYIVTNTVLVCNPVVIMNKEATPTIIGPGGTVVFQVCIVNSSIISSTFNVVVSDYVPGWTMYYGPNAYWNNSAGAPTFGESYAATYGAASWTNGEPVNGQTAVYLRWTFGYLGPAKSACVTYFGVVQ